MTHKIHTERYGQDSTTLSGPHQFETSGTDGVITIWKFPEMGVPKAPIFVGLSLINHPFEGTPTLGNPHMSNHLKTETVHPFPY